MPKVSGIFRTLSLFFAAVEGTVEPLRPPSLLFAFHFSLPHSLITPSSLPHHSLITHSFIHSLTSLLGSAIVIGFIASCGTCCPSGAGMLSGEVYL
jgi:hypothetical protein